MPARGGTPRTLVQVDPKVEVATLPRLINNGRHVLFTLRRVGESGSKRPALSRRMSPAGVARKSCGLAGSGMSLAVRLPRVLRGTDLMAVAFDEAGLRVTGDPVRSASGLASAVAVSRGGTLAYQLAARCGGPGSGRVDRGGKEEPIGVPAQPTTMLRVSPDGTRLAMTNVNEDPGVDVRKWHDCAVERDRRRALGCGVDARQPAPVFSGGPAVTGSALFRRPRTARVRRPSSRRCRLGFRTPFVRWQVRDFPPGCRGADGPAVQSAAPARR